MTSLTRKSTPTAQRQQVNAPTVTIPSVFARWDDPMGRYADSYTVQAEVLLDRLKSVASSIQDRIREQQQVESAEKERLERLSPSTSRQQTARSEFAGREGGAAIEMIFPDTTRFDILVARLEQQLVVGKRLRKIIEHYSDSPTSSSSTSRSHAHDNPSAVLVGGVAWCAVAGQVKAAMAGFLQQLRLDVLCALSVVMEAERRREVLFSGRDDGYDSENGNTNSYRAQRQRQQQQQQQQGSGFDYKDPAEHLVHDVAKAFFTINNEIYRLVDDVATPLVERASTSVASVMESMMTFSSPSSASLSGRSAVATGAGGDGTASHISGSRRSAANYQTTSTATQQLQQQQQQQQQNVVTLSSSCPEYLNCLALSSDPAITALSVACRGNEHLHSTHVDMLRGLMSSVVLGLIRRHSLLTGAVRMIRDISQKYHRIVDGQNALRTIRKSVALVMGGDDKIPEPAENMLEVDNLGRLLQETLATAAVLKETCTVLRHWAFDPNDNTAAPSTASLSSPSFRHSFDNPPQTRTAVAQLHAKTNGQYLLATLRNMSSLLRRVAVASDKTLTTWSEPALNSFCKILEVHSAPLLQCARVMANAQTDLKQLIGLCKEKAIHVEEMRTIEDTIAVLGTTVTSLSSSSSSPRSSLLYTSLDQQLREIETLARSLHSVASRSTGILNEVVTTICKPIAANSPHLPFQFVDNEIDTLTSALAQLCKQHDSIIVNLKSTTTATWHSSAAAAASSALTLEEMTTTVSAARLMNESEQRAVAASCSFDRLNAICAEIDNQCDLWFRSRHISNKITKTVSSTATSNQEQEQALDEESLLTAAPSALLPPGVRNEDRIFTMNVLRGTMRHLQGGEESFLAVPRPDSVNSAAALNDFEDEFSVAFVGVEGLCEQVFAINSRHPHRGPQISITSASSLDVLAKVGATAAAAAASVGGNSPGGGRGDHHHHHHHRGGGMTSTHSNANNYLTSGSHRRTNSGGSSVSVGNSSFGNNQHQQHQQQQNQQLPPTISVTNNDFFPSRLHSTSSNSPQQQQQQQQQNQFSRRQRSNTVIFDKHQNFLTTSSMPAQAMSAAATLASPSSIDPHAASRYRPINNHNSVSQQNSFSNESESSVSAGEATVAGTSTPTHSMNQRSNKFASLGVRSFTYQAAMLMPEHEMIPPELS